MDENTPMTPLPDEVEIPAPQPQTQEVPEVQVVFDTKVAGLWLGNAGARKSNTFLSVRFEPDGMPTKQLNFLLSLAARSIAPGEVKTRKGLVLGTGTLYVPVGLAKNPVLDTLVRGKRVGKYVSFTK